MAISKSFYALAIVLVFGLTMAQLCWSLSVDDPNKSLADLMKENPGTPLRDLLKKPHNLPPNFKPLGRPVNNKPHHKHHNKPHNPPVNNKPVNPPVNENPPAKNPVENKLPVEIPAANKPLDAPLGVTALYMAPQNAVRAKLGLPPLVWNQSLVEYATSYAKERSVDCKLQHSNYGDKGENIAMSTGDMTPAEAVEMWLGEQPQYDYGSNTCKDMCGHYTQIIWRDTKSIGCAKERCQNGGTFITCNYYPGGNVVGEKPY